MKKQKWSDDSIRSDQQHHAGDDITCPRCKASVGSPSQRDLSGWWRAQCTGSAGCGAVVLYASDSATGR